MGEGEGGQGDGLGNHVRPWKKKGHEKRFLRDWEQRDIKFRNIAHTCSLRQKSTEWHNKA